MLCITITLDMLSIFFFVVWLKYDDKYSEFLKEKASKNYQANQIALEAYQARYTKEIEEPHLK